VLTTPQDQYSGRCLRFVHDAYQYAGVDLNAYLTFVPNNNTYPNEVWPGIWNGWKDNAQPPPYGALVFYLYPSYDPDSHVTISTGGGNEISTADKVNENNVHFETISQHASSGAVNTYVGWWLFA